VRSTIRQAGRLAVVAMAACVSFGVLSGAAFAADDEPDLSLTLAEIPSAAPGSIVELRSVVENVSTEATHGVMLNLSLPANLSVAPGSTCLATGENGEGGTLVSCTISGSAGNIDPGGSVEATTPLQIAKDAAAGTELGTLRALAVPAGKGAPTGDLSNLVGHNVAEASISTLAGEVTSDMWSSIRALFS
jgi:hypothetical protein